MGIIGAFVWFVIAGAVTAPFTYLFVNWLLSEDEEEAQEDV